TGDRQRIGAGLSLVNLRLAGRHRNGTVAGVAVVEGTGQADVAGAGAGRIAAEAHAGAGAVDRRIEAQGEAFGIFGNTVDRQQVGQGNAVAATSPGQGEGTA